MGAWRPGPSKGYAWKRLFFVTIVILCSEFCTCQDFVLPPTVWVDRNWVIPEDEPIGTRVAQAKASEPDPNLIFSLEPFGYLDGSTFFKIDSKTGAVYLNESMQGKSGKEYYLSLQAQSGGGIPVKIDIYIQITPPATSSASPKRTGSPVNPVPKKPSVPVVNGDTGGILTVHDDRRISKIPAFPPNLTPPPYAVTPPPPPADPQPSTVSTTFGGKTPAPPKDPPIPTETTKANVAAEGVDNVLPPFPPHVTNPNKNLYDVEDSHEKEKTEVDDPQVTSNDLGEAGPSKQVLPSPSSTANATFGTGKDDTTNYIVIFTIVPIVLVFGVVPIVVASIWLVRRRTRVKKRPTKEMRKESAATSNSSMTMSGEPISPSALRQWIKQAQSNRYESWNPEGGGDGTANAENRWEFPRHHLQVGKILGEGCFGQVWQCEALNIDGKEGISTVAVKTLKEGAGEREKGDLLSELAVMKMLDPHPHVVRLLGACTEKEPLFLIMEYVALGKLQSFLRNSRSTHYYPNLHADSSSLSSKDLTAFCYQIARGMEYLASKGIIHRDLAARNILIDKDRVCKVADFGFARDVVANHVYERKTDGRLPVRWMAPEALYDNIFTTKTDIWSFGVLMWEIVTLGSTPYPGISAAEVMRRVREGYRLEKPEHCRRELYNIMFYCWAGNPDDRPTFTDLVNFLKHLLFSETDYIELDRFPDHDYYNYMSNQTSGEKL